MSSWFEERRADKAADAVQRREDREFESKLRRDERRKDRDEDREVKAQQRRDRAQRRQARTARREKTLTPGNVYRKGTLALVLASAAASLPAQVMHFVGISLMLLPIPFALEGAAWVMNAGVAYADERKLPAWVRWLMRVLAMTAAGYAAHINLGYGLSLEGHGLSAADAAAVGWGLAAVTMLGPLFFEVRQWVLTLTAAVTDPKKRAEEKARAAHEKKRRRHHKTVADIADRLISAAPYGSLKFEDAWTQAWAIVHGTDKPGMTPKFHAYAVRSAAALDAALEPAPVDEVAIRRRILDHFRRGSKGPGQPLRYVLPTPAATALGVTGKPQVVTDLPPASKTAPGKPKNGSRRQPPPHRRSKGDALPFHPLAKTQAADTARQHAVVNGHHH
ncbi:hypothetical protein [Streptomyces sp. NPDC058466]|uniref:hypothetical protein n=1 Tax=Streptomyces sp. NPDC058466 TaxID=3346512 RepID=UPI0036686DA4